VPFYFRSDLNYTWVILESTTTCNFEDWLEHVVTAPARAAQSKLEPKTKRDRRKKQSLYGFSQLAKCFPPYVILYLGEKCIMLVPQGLGYRLCSLHMREWTLPWVMRNKMREKSNAISPFNLRQWVIIWIDEE
jgi:hypothetical protein